MIDESEINELSEDLTQKRVREFFERNKNKMVYFYHNSDIAPQAVDTLHSFNAGELIIPLRSNEDGTFAVMYTNKKLAYSLIEQGFKVASSKCGKFIEMANSLKPVNGIFVQGNNCWFTVGLSQLTK